MERRYRSIVDLRGFSDGTICGQSKTDPSGYEPIRQKINRLFRQGFRAPVGAGEYDLAHVEDERPDNLLRRCLEAFDNHPITERPGYDHSDGYQLIESAKVFLASLAKQKSPAGKEGQGTGSAATGTAPGNPQAQKELLPEAEQPTGGVVGR